jgi:Heparan-alpha-glucosaminide N-acetyltransferase, catalytic
VLGVDVARSLALFAMMSVHIFPSFREDGSLHPAYVVSAGRAAALFAMLAGVGLALASGGTEPPRDRRLREARAGVLARALVLVGIGLLLGQVNSPPLVILAYYGLLFVLAIPFLGLRSRSLALLAMFACVVAPVVSQWLREVVSPTPIGEPGGRDVLKELFLTGTYPALTWTTYLFVGLAIGRADLRRRGVAVSLLVGGIIVAVVAKLASAALLSAAGGAGRLHASLPPDNFFAVDTDRWLREGLYGTTPTADWRWLLISSPHSGTTFDLAHTCGTSAAVLGACVLLVRVLPRWSYLPLAATGSMTLTLYSAHVLALAHGSPLLNDDPLHLWIGHVIVAIVVATLWRTLIGRGPLEWLAAQADRGARRLPGIRASSAVQDSVILDRQRRSAATWLPPGSGS